MSSLAIFSSRVRKSHYTIKKLKRKLKRKASMRKKEKALKDPEISPKEKREKEAQVAQLLMRIINNKIETEGEGFIKTDSDPNYILDILDLRELTEMYPDAHRDHLIIVIQKYIERAYRLERLKTVLELFHFFMANSYEKYYKKRFLLGQKLEEHEPMLREIFSGTDLRFFPTYEFYMCFYIKARRKKKSMDQELSEYEIAHLAEIEQIVG
ncbi:hypothetical protein QJS04_geneDACA011046 [Acorus gramineus]|uniref:Uncharacterized protein n=1 Tax=Acorus gramineus TaxID=55184 RepID=A0AAV9BHM1_ACOGR|nr:hypothetical protein QJS04_geneDACA011046 [Acorus gramineus]